MAVFLPVRSEGKTVFDGKSNLYSAKTLAAHRIPAAGAWPHGLPCRGTQQLRRHTARPGIPLLGALDVACPRPQSTTPTSQAAYFLSILVHADGFFAAPSRFRANLKIPKCSFFKHFLPFAQVQPARRGQGAEYGFFRWTCHQPDGQHRT